jgi:hypothetical protein
MERYLNLAGNSGVLEYEIGDEWIRIRFRNGAVYRYTYGSAGRAGIERMKDLARAGRGLSTFVSTTVRDHYADKDED